MAGVVSWVTADIEALRGRFDTVLQNPPFGVQRRGADRKFILKALELGRRIYSLHKSVSRDRLLINRLGRRGIAPARPSPFLKGLIERHGGRILSVYTMVMTIPHLFEFHERRKHRFLVDLYVIERISQA